MAEGPRRRLVLVMTLLGAGVLLTVAQLVKVQVLDHQFYARWAEEQRVRSIRMDQPPRGLIADRSGHVLAGNGVIYAVEAAPAHIRDKEQAAKALAAVLHMPASHLEAELIREDAQGNYRQWVRIASSVSKDVGEDVAGLSLGGITVKPVWQRAYPEGSLASHVLGFATSETGYYGVEGFYDPMLHPEPVEWVGPVDVESVPIPWQPISGEFPRRGVNLELTLDRMVQGLIEDELARALKAYGAQSGTIIVMEPETFGILGMASSPAYDPENYSDLAERDPLLFEDPAVSRQYEPGSVFKVVTVGAALAAGIVSPDTVYHDQGWIEVGGQAVRNSTGKVYGDQSVTNILVRSLNTGAAWLSTTLGPERFYRTVQAFGFGSPTHIDLAGEVSGQLWLPADIEHWHPSNLGTNAFGQGIAVTPLQMVTAVAAVANDGARLRPHVVNRRIASDGTVSTFQPVFIEQAIPADVAQTLTQMMVEVVEEGATEAQVEGYRVAGKTGTAQIPIPGGYDPQGTIATFVGFGPVPDPAVVILVKLDRPQTSEWASRTAAPTFARVAGRLFKRLGIPPEEGLSVAEVAP